MNNVKVLTYEEYKDAGGNLCPFCHGTDIEGNGLVEVESNIAWQDVGCNDCDATWRDEYVLHGWTRN